MKVNVNKKFLTLQAAYNYAAGLINAGVTMEASRVYCDQFKRNRRNVTRMVLGVDRRADALCRRLAPGGTWGVEVESPGTQWYSAGILGEILHTLSLHRCSAWYSKYLPYAYAMTRAEYAFRCVGIDFASINSYFGTCMGFQYMVQESDPGFDHKDHQGWDRIEPADRELYQEVMTASHRVRPPDLPFDEVFQVAAVFVAIQAPHLLKPVITPDSWVWTHIGAVCEELHRPAPPAPGTRKVRS